MATKRLYDVIVVGAGLAGLSAAYHLSLAGKNTLVLEGSNRIGGRILSERIGDTVINHGGQWINPNHKMIMQISSALGLDLDQQSNSGAHRFAQDDLITYFEGTLPKVSFTDKITLNRLSKNLDRASKHIDKERPWLSQQANKLDKMRFSQYLKNNLLTKRHYGVIKPVLEGNFLNSIDQISALHGVLEWQDQNQEKWQVIGGSDQLPRRLAQEVNVNCRAMVKQIELEGSFLKIICPKESYRCRWVIVALPPVQASEIRYNPPISTSKTSMWNSIEPGRMIKTNIIFEEPFWRSDSWSGKAFVSGDRPFQYLVDSGTQQDQRGVISTYTIGASCLPFEKMDQEQIKQVILEQVLDLLKSKPNSEPSFHLCDWKCPPNGHGAYHIFPPGLLTNYEDQLSRREGPIFWASAEYDPIHRGTMEGAIRSGLKAATQIIHL